MFHFTFPHKVFKLVIDKRNAQNTKSWNETVGQGQQIHWNF